TLEDLNVIYREVARLEQTVQGFLDFARPPLPRPSRCDLRQVVNRALDLVRARIKQTNAKLNVRLPEAPTAAFVDSAQMSTVLVNLMLNALDAMPQGGQLDVSLMSDGGTSRLRIADNGPGIAPAILPRLFTPFATSKSTGTGLGLSL